MMNQSKFRFESFIAFGFVLFYLAFRFYFIHSIDVLGKYASYIFELLFVCVVLFFYRKQIQLLRRPQKLNYLEFFLALTLGFCIFKFAKIFEIPIPFDLKNTELILFLIVIGPILEELIFRQALWVPLEVILKKSLFVTLTTAMIFSFGHFHAYFFVPHELKSFVIYQSIYTFLIALWWGHRYAFTRTLCIPILLHILFNLGFYLGFIL